MDAAPGGFRPSNSTGGGWRSASRTSRTSAFGPCSTPASPASEFLTRSWSSDVPGTSAHPAKKIPEEQVNPMVDFGEDFGADDGIRTRDPQLGKVVVFVPGVLLDPIGVWFRLPSFRYVQPIRRCSRAIYYRQRFPDELRALFEMAASVRHAHRYQSHLHRCR
jgi:hypothetical protein